jgi:hypothetical protein
LVDGSEIEGNILPDFADGRTHEVKVVLGYSSGQNVPGNKYK